MLYALFVCNIILSLFILSVIIYCFYNVEFLDKIFDRIEKTAYLLIGTLLAFLILIVSVITTEQMWIDKYWVSVDAVVTNSKTITERVNYGEDEAGIDDIEYSTKYKITYDFHYNDKQYQITKTETEDRPIGTVESIKINPHNVKSNQVFTTTIVIALISIGGCLIILKLLMHIFKKSEHNHP